MNSQNSVSFLPQDISNAKENETFEMTIKNNTIDSHPEFEVPDLISDKDMININEDNETSAADQVLIETDENSFYSKNDNI